MKNKIYISGWSGRFGNNLEQIASSVLFAKCVDGTTEVSMPNSNNYSHLLSTENNFFIDKEYDYNVVEFFDIDWNTNCYYTPALNYINEDYKSLIIENASNIFRKYIRPILKFEDKNNDISKDTLTIHLRGGDILDNTHSLYKQNFVNWEFYESVIQKYKNVIVCREDDKNPFYQRIVNFCLEKNIKIFNEKRDISEDYYILLNSYNILLSGFSTFSLTASYMNEKLNNFYYPKIVTDCQVHKENFRLKILSKTQCKMHFYDNNAFLSELFFE